MAKTLSDRDTADTRSTTVTEHQFARYRARLLFGPAHPPQAYAGGGIVGGALSQMERAVAGSMSAYDGCPEHEAAEALYGDLLAASHAAYRASEARAEGAF